MAVLGSPGPLARGQILTQLTLLTRGVSSPLLLEFTGSFRLITINAKLGGEVLAPLPPFVENNATSMLSN